MSTSRVEDTYEAQNDQRLDELHSKIRTLRGVRLSHTHYRSLQS
jgi:blocked-early-in-transport protein 1